MNNLTLEQINEINLIAQQISDKKTGLHTGKLTTNDFIKLCEKVVEIKNREE